MNRLQQQQKTLESQLGDTGLYADERREELRRHLAEKVSVDRDLADTEEQWLEISEQIEAAQSGETY